MSASEEQLEAHRAQEEARAREERERREAFVASLKEAYDEAHGRVVDAIPPGEHFTIARQREAERSALLAVAERACRAHAADLLRIECDLNAALIGPQRPEKNGHRNTFVACAAVGAMRRLRARMRGKAPP